MSGTNTLYELPKLEYGCGDSAPYMSEKQLRIHHGKHRRAYVNGGNVLELVACLTDYQDGAVVIREIVKKETGTVTVFAFDKGRGLREHIAPFNTLVQMLDGVAEITIGGTPHCLVKNDMILMPAKAPCTMKAIERFKILSVMTIADQTADKAIGEEY